MDDLDSLLNEMGVQPGHAHLTTLGSLVVDNHDNKGLVQFPFGSDLFDLLQLKKIVRLSRRKLPVLKRPARVRRSALVAVRKRRKERLRRKLSPKFLQTRRISRLFSLPKERRRVARRKLRLRSLQQKLRLVSLLLLARKKVSEIVCKPEMLVASFLSRQSQQIMSCRLQSLCHVHVNKSNAVTRICIIDTLSPANLS